MTTINADALYNLQEAAEQLGLSPATLDRRRKAKKIACCFDGRWLRFTGRQLLDYLATTTIPATAAPTSNSTAPSVPSVP